MRLEAADGLALSLDPGAPWRLAWDTPDWLGPLGFEVRFGGERWVGPEPMSGAETLAATLRPFEGVDDLGAFRGFEVAWESAPLPLRTCVRAYAERPVLVFRLEALDDLEGLASGSFGDPALVWPAWHPTRRAPDGLPEGTRGFGHQFTEFAFATFAGPELADFFLFPHRPAVIEPLWLVRPDGRALLLAPLDAFHEQVFAVPRSPEHAEVGLRCGWQGDLDAVPRGFASELAIWAGPGPRRVAEAWGGFLRERHGTRRPSRYADDAVGRLSYWTDNGAAYWYRTEPGLDLPETLEHVASSLREQRVPVRAFELDSWFYPHEASRPVGPEEPGHVPPTGLLAWEPRGDVLPEGVHDLQRRLGGAPLILHGRHISRRSPYLDRYASWIDGDRAHPTDGELFEHWMAQAAGWGAISYEQDWLVESFFGVRGLREGPGRARAWQEALDRAAGEHGLSLIWCMATPADFFQTVTLERVVSIRTSGDYRYLAENPAHWVRFLYTNALARALGLLPFKDVFLSARNGSGWDGDRWAEPEALLAALSAGPVGIGDRIGRTDREVVMRTCRDDGVLVKPDVPIAALERCFLRDCFLEPEPLVGETHSQHPAGRWVYLASFHAWRGEEPLRLALPLAELGVSAPRGPVVLYDWRRRDFARLPADGALTHELAPGDWDLRVVCPILPGEVTLFGDVTRYASVGDRRVRAIRSTGAGLEFDVLGAPDEPVEIQGWCARPFARASEIVAGRECGMPRVARDRASPPSWWREDGSGRFGVVADVGPRGWAHVRLGLY